MIRFPKSPSSRWLAGIVLAVLVLIIVSVVLALVNRRGVELLPENTAEGVVQRYVLAIQDGDATKAFSYLNGELQRGCDYRRFRDSIQTWQESDMRFTLEGTQALNGQTEVQIRVTHINVSPLFGTEEYSNTERFFLEREGDVWRFSEPPPPVWVCPDAERKGTPPPPTPAQME